MYSPAPVVTVVFCTLVAVLVAMTVAFGTTAPVGSAMVPRMAPWPVSWAWLSAGRMSARTRTTLVQRRTCTHTARSEDEVVTGYLRKSFQWDCAVSGKWVELV